MIILLGELNRLYHLGNVAKAKRYQKQSEKQTDSKNVVLRVLVEHVIRQLKY